MDLLCGFDAVDGAFERDIYEYKIGTDVVGSANGFFAGGDGAGDALTS